MKTDLLRMTCEVCGRRLPLTEFNDQGICSSCEESQFTAELPDMDSKQRRYTRSELELWDRGELIDAVQTLESEPDNNTASKWIPVTEALPSRDTGFLLLYIDFHEPRVPSAIRFGYYDNPDRRWCTPYGRLKEHWQVTHWMPLPDPPGEAEDETDTEYYSCGDCGVYFKYPAEDDLRRPICPECGSANISEIDGAPKAP